MNINQILLYNKKKYFLEYFDSDNFSDLDKDLCIQAYGVCFFKEKIVIVFNQTSSHWSFPGGTIEKNETLEYALEREVLEETNMKILKQIPIGYQKVTDKDGNIEYQLRSFCKVIPNGIFENDPDGDISEIKLIKPKEYRKYIDWGEIGERIMQRAIELNI